MTRALREVCPVCEISHALKKDGAFYLHLTGYVNGEMVDGQVCPGSGLSPERIHEQEMFPYVAPENNHRRGNMTQLTIGPPTKPPTVLNAEGLKLIHDRLNMLTDIDLTSRYDESMAPALKSIAEALLTQDLPALLAAYESPECQDCASIHRVHHVTRERRALIS